jgi:hypothetical protein
MTTGIIAGAIRWDPWYARNPTQNQAQNALSPQKYQSRAPWFSTVVSPFQITSVGSQANMDYECQLAAAAGIKYWAFVYYGGNADGSVAPTDMYVSLPLYQTSANKNLVNWCGIIGISNLGTFGFSTHTSNWQQNVNTWVTYMLQSNYQKVLTNRPLLYILWSVGDLINYFDNNIAEAATAIAYLRSQCIAAGLGSPYIVLMDGSGAGAHSTLVSLGADALSNYIGPITYTTLPTPYTILDTGVRAFWTSLNAQGDPIIPICQTGWDVKARNAYREDFAAGRPYMGQNQRVLLSTNTEFATHVQAAIDYIGANPSICPSKALLMYAWTECDEGGGMIPTIGDPPVNANVNGTYTGVLTSTRLNTLSPVLTAAA